MKTSKIRGHCVLTLRDGSQRRVANRAILALVDDVGRAMHGAPWPVPDSVYQNFPILKEFRDCRSVYSEGDDHLFEILLGLVRPPAPTPAAIPVEGGCSVQ